LRRSRNEIVDADLHHFVDPSSITALNLALEKVYERGVFLDEFSLMDENHTLLPFEWGAKLDLQSGVVVWTGRHLLERKVRKELLQAQLDEKDVLVKEVHHRVKNQFQILSSLLQLQAQAMPIIEEILKTTQNRIQSMALIHESLYLSESRGDIELSQYLKHLVENLYTSYGVRKERLKLCYECQPQTVKVNTAVTVGLITNEILSNSFKYAFPNGDPGEICLRGYRENSHIVLEVGDNGIGLPPGADPNKSNTLGLKLVGLLTAQVSGSFQLDLETGTKYIFSFPL
jgi:two-component sensor histidine kinase